MKQTACVLAFEPYNKKLKKSRIRHYCISKTHDCDYIVEKDPTRPFSCRHQKLYDDPEYVMECVCKNARDEAMKWVKKNLK